MVVVRNSCHYGIAGYYATQATEQGCIGMTGTNARPSVAPTWGVDGMFGTNPFTIGVPTDENSISSLTVQHQSHKTARLNITQESTSLFIPAQ